MAQAKALMIQGTGSHVGKSLLTAAFCRILSNQGVRVAPFKAQNMSLNSFVTADGAEVSRAQALQAEAARMPIQAEMNPVLLKPTSDTGSQVIVLGRVIGTMSAKDYHQYKAELWPVVETAYHRLAAEVDVMVIEGAGSPAEINLRAHDIVNMRVAAMAGAAVLLVGDIDRGGVFAALLGTMEWLEPEERRRVVGFLINKFRGDLSLLGPGLEALARRTGVPVLGVIPSIQDLHLEEEDGVALDDRRQRSRGEGSDRFTVGVPRFPRLSNFTDLDPLAAEPAVAVRFVTCPAELASCRVAILPGSKNTIEDLAWLRRQGLDKAIRSLYERGGSVIGICGGYQMLGRRIRDPHAVETGQGQADGLGLLPVDTVLEQVKQTVQMRYEPAGAWVCATHAGRIGGLTGYEIHMGRTARAAGYAPAFRVLDRAGHEAAAVEEDGARSPDGRVWGSYAHGLFENDRFRQCLLSRWMSRPCPDEPRFSYALLRGRGLQKLAEVVSGSVDLRTIRRYLGV